MQYALKNIPIYYFLIIYKKKSLLNHIEFYFSLLLNNSTYLSDIKAQKALYFLFITILEPSIIFY
jgi:hypothetical protein